MLINFIYKKSPCFFALFIIYSILSFCGTAGGEFYVDIDGHVNLEGCGVYSSERLYYVVDRDGTNYTYSNFRDVCSLQEDNVLLNSVRLLCQYTHSSNAFDAFYNSKEDFILEQRYIGLNLKEYLSTLTSDFIYIYIDSPEDDQEDNQKYDSTLKVLRQLTTVTEKDVMNDQVRIIDYNLWDENSRPLLGNVTIQEEIGGGLTTICSDTNGANPRLETLSYIEGEESQVIVVESGGVSIRGSGCPGTVVRKYIFNQNNGLVRIEEKYLGTDREVITYISILDEKKFCL